MGALFWIIDGYSAYGQCARSYQINSKLMPVTGENRLSALLPDDLDAQLFALCAVNHRIGKRLEREDSAVFRGRRPKARMLEQELNDVLKFIQNVATSSRLFAVASISAREARITSARTRPCITVVTLAVARFRIRA